MLLGDGPSRRLMFYFTGGGIRRNPLFYIYHSSSSSSWILNYLCGCRSVVKYVKKLKLCLIDLYFVHSFWTQQFYIVKINRYVPEALRQVSLTPEDL